MGLGKDVVVVGGGGILLYSKWIHKLSLQREREAGEI